MISLPVGKERTHFCAAADPDWRRYSQISPDVDQIYSLIVQHIRLRFTPMSQGYYVLSPSAAPRDAAPRSDVRMVVVQRDVTEIGDDAFRSWACLEEVVFEPGSRLEHIGAHAFASTSLKKFVAPDSLRSIGEGAFAGCRKLKSVTLNKGL